MTAGPVDASAVIAVGTHPCTLVDDVRCWTLTPATQGRPGIDVEEIEIRGQKRKIVIGRIKYWIRSLRKLYDDEKDIRRKRQSTLRPVRYPWLYINK